MPPRMELGSVACCKRQGGGIGQIGGLSSTLLAVLRGQAWTGQRTGFGRAKRDWSVSEGEAEAA